MRIKSNDKNFMDELILENCLPQSKIKNVMKI